MKKAKYVVWIVAVAIVAAACTGSKNTDGFVTVEDGDHNSLPDDMGPGEYISLIKEFVDGADLATKKPKCEMPAALNHGGE